VTTNRIASPRASFHGWKILFLATLSQFVSVGFTVYLLGLFIEPLSKTFSATPGQLGWASSIFLLVGSGLGPVLGQLADKGRTRIVLVAGSLSLALGFAALSQAQSLLQAALACVFLIAPGAAMLGVVTVGALLVQWFHRRRGMALGIAAVGISGGGFLMPPIVAALFAHFDWRIGTLILGAFVAVVMTPCAWWLTVNRPADLGQFPDGDSAPPAASAAQAAAAAPPGFREMIAQRTFWLIAAVIGSINFSSILLLTYLIPYARERGIPVQASALVISTYAGAAILGKFTSGWLADHIESRRLLSGITVLMALGLLPMLLVDGTVPIFVSAAIVGFALGGLIPAWATVIAESFGAQSFGRAKGAMSLAVTVLAVIPGPLGGYLHDATGSYHIAFVMLIAVLAVGFAVSFAIPGRRRTA